MDAIPTTTTYLASKVIEADLNGDGYFEGKTIEYYALNGQIAYKTYEQINDAQTIIYQSNSEYTYNPQNNLASILTKIDYNNDGIDSTDYSNYSYDINGNLIFESFESDQDNDNLIDYRSTVTNSYDNSDRLISNVFIKDTNGDNANIYGITSSISYTYSYDANGLILSKTYDTNGGYYGANNYHYIYTYNYDANNKVSSELTTGHLELKTLRFPNTVFSHFIYGYNSEGNLISEIKEVDNSNNGSIESKELASYIYDASNRLISSTKELDKNNDGIVDDLSWETWFYDLNGNLSSRVYQFDRRNDGIIDDRIIQEYTYNSLGNILSESYRNETDYPTDGTIRIYSFSQTDYYYQTIIEPDPIITPDPIVILDPTLEPEPIILPNPILEPDPEIFPEPIVIKVEPNQLPTTIAKKPEEPLSPKLEGKPKVDYRPLLLDFQDITGLHPVTFTLNREAAFDNFVGFYKIADEQGGIDINGDGRADLLPGDDGYTAAVLGNYEQQITLMVANNKTSVLVSELAGGSLYAPFLIAHGIPQDPSCLKSEAVYFAFSAANRDGAEHIKLIDSHLCFEDWFGGGDNDFNDAVIQVTV